MTADELENTDETEEKYRYPIDNTMQVPMQARASAIRAGELNLTIGHRNLDLSQGLQVEAFYDELGLDAILPPDNGVYHLFYVRADTGEEFPLNIPQAHARYFVLGLAARDSLSSAQEFAGGPGILPLPQHDPIRNADNDEDEDEGEGEPV